MRLLRIVHYGRTDSRPATGSEAANPTEVEVPRRRPLHLTRAARARRGTICGVGLESSLWRAIAVYRVGSLAYAIFLTANAYQTYDRPALGWVVIGGMAAWTGVAAWVYRDPRRRQWPLLALDLAVACLALYASRFVIDREALERGAA